MAKFFSKYSVVLITVFFCSVVVFPNGHRELKLPILLLSSLLMFSAVKFIRQEIYFVIGAGVVVNLIYLAIGMQNTSYPDVLFYQIVTVYIISPIFWSIFGVYLFKYYGASWVSSRLVVFGLLGSIVTFLAYYLWDSNNIELLQLITGMDDVMVDLRAGRIGARLHVYGSLIFIYTAMFGLITKSLDIKNAAIVFIFFITAIFSGRQFLLLSFFVGYGLFLVYSFNNFNKNLKLLKTNVVFVGFIVMLMFMDVYFEVHAIDTLYRKLFGFSGDLRSTQVENLFEGINSNLLLGSGHGATVADDRLKSRVWSYEVLSVATVYRVGVVGFLVFSIPLLLSIKRYFKLCRLGLVSAVDSFFMFGLISTSLSIFSNPYLESIEFQWAYFIPYVYFLMRKDDYNRNA